MRSNIIFSLLFLLSFSIMHDTTINALKADESITVTHYVDLDTATEECGDIYEIHSMFHFVGVMTLYKSPLLQFQKEKTLSHDLLRYTLPYKKTSYRPPIA